MAVSCQKNRYTVLNVCLVQKFIVNKSVNNSNILTQRRFHRVSYLVLCEKKTTRIISVAGIHTIGCLLHVLTAQQLLHEVDYCRRYMLNKLC